MRSYYGYAGVSSFGHLIQHVMEPLNTMWMPLTNEVYVGGEVVEMRLVASWDHQPIAEDWSAVTHFLLPTMEQRLRERYGLSDPT